MKNSLKKIIAGRKAQSIYVISQEFYRRMVFNIQKDALKQVYSNSSSYAITLVSGLVLAAILFYFTEYELIVGNVGKVHANVQVISQIILSLLFGVNIAILWYKLRLTNGIDVKAQGSTAAGSVLALLVSGCPACGVTLAGYLGLASVFSALPFLGLELKVIGILLLLYSSNYLLKKLNYCAVPTK